MDRNKYTFCCTSGSLQTTPSQSASFLKSLSLNFVVLNTSCLHYPKEFHWFLCLQSENNDARAPLIRKQQLPLAPWLPCQPGGHTQVSCRTFHPAVRRDLPCTNHPSEPILMSPAASATPPSPSHGVKDNCWPGCPVARPRFHKEIRSSSPRERNIKTTSPDDPALPYRVQSMKEGT